MRCVFDPEVSADTRPDDDPTDCGRDEYVSWHGLKVMETRPAGWSFPTSNSSCIQLFPHRKGEDIVESPFGIVTSLKTSELSSLCMESPYSYIAL